MYFLKWKKLFRPIHIPGFIFATYRWVQKNRWCLHWIWKHPFPSKKLYIYWTVLWQNAQYIQQSKIKNKNRTPECIPPFEVPRNNHRRCLKFFFNSFFYIFHPKVWDLYSTSPPPRWKIRKNSFQYTTVQLAFNNTTWPTP